MTVATAQLGDVAEFIMGQAPPGSDCNTRGEGTVFVKAGEFDERFPVVREWTTNPLKLAKDGDVLVCVVGATAGKVNQAIDCAIGRSVAAVRPALKRIDTGYLFHFLSSQVSRLRAKSQGLAQGVITKDMLGEIETPLPPLAEQRRIAAILDAADALRQKRRQALRLLDQLSQSIFIEMFGDPEAAGWPTATVADVAESSDGSIRTGPFGSQLLHSEFVEEGIAVLGIDNAVSNQFIWSERRYITDSKYRELKRYTVRPGDVIITIMGTCGRCAVVPNDIPLAINTKHLCCITLDQKKCIPEFLHAYFLQHPIARRYLGQTEKGAIMAGLNMGIIKELPVALPPLELQQMFVRRIRALSGTSQAHQRSLDEFDSLFTSLQHRAFRGEL